MQVCEGDTLHQTRPNSGSNGAECSATEHERSKVGPMTKEPTKTAKEEILDTEKKEEPIF
eukprot:11944044-Ditylum_brightwellii.AAC.2